MHHRRPFLLLALLVTIVISFNVQATTLWPKNTKPLRIISLAPNITEILFALGAGEQLVGVTDYCDYPSAATALAKVGGGLNPSLETIIALTPDLVILSASQQKLIKQLQQLGLRTLAVKGRTLEDIRHAITLIGHTSGRHSESAVLLAHFDAQLAMIQQKVAGLSRPQVMISIGHSLGSDSFKQFYIAGQQDFYNDLIQLAGGENVYQKPFPKVPSISLEGLFHLNPDIIIDVFPEANDHSASTEQVRQQWSHLSHISAIKYSRLHIIEADYATIPGPRIIQLLTQFAAIIHPELAWPRDTTD
jgi:iron complex transport system substrate-binding protein